MMILISNLINLLFPLLIVERCNAAIFTDTTISGNIGEDITTTISWSDITIFSVTIKTTVGKPAEKYSTTCTFDTDTHTCTDCVTDKGSNIEGGCPSAPSQIVFTFKNLIESNHGRHLVDLTDDKSKANIRYIDVIVSEVTTSTGIASQDTTTPSNPEPCPRSCVISLCVLFPCLAIAIIIVIIVRYKQKELCKSHPTPQTNGKQCEIKEGNETKNESEPSTDPTKESPEKPNPQTDQSKPNDKSAQNSTSQNVQPISNNKFEVSMHNEIYDDGK